MVQKIFLTFFQRQKSGWFSKLGSFAGRKSFWNLPILGVQKFARLKILKTSIFFGWKSFKKPSVYAALRGIDTPKKSWYDTPTVKGWNTFFQRRCKNIKCIFEEDVMNHFWVWNERYIINDLYTRTDGTSSSKGTVFVSA